MCIYNNTPLLVYKNAGCFHGSKSLYTLNLSTIKPTKNSNNQKLLSQELHRPKRKMRQTFYKKIKNLSIFLFGDVKAPLKGVILFDDYNLL